MWEGQGKFKATLLAEVGQMTVGSVTEFAHFMGPVMYALVLSPDCKTHGH